MDTLSSLPSGREPPMPLGTVPPELWRPSCEDLRTMVEKLLADWLGRATPVRSVAVADIPDALVRGLEISGAMMGFVIMRAAPSLAGWIRTSMGSACRKDTHLNEVFKEFASLMVCRLVTMLKDRCGRQFVFRMVPLGAEHACPPRRPDVEAAFTLMENALSIDLWLDRAHVTSAGVL